MVLFWCPQMKVGSILIHMWYLFVYLFNFISRPSSVVLNKSYFNNFENFDHLCPSFDFLLVYPVIKTNSHLKILIHFFITAPQLLFLSQKLLTQDNCANKVRWQSQMQRFSKIPLRNSRVFSLALVDDRSLWKTAKLNEMHATTATKKEQKT